MLKEIIQLDSLAGLVRSIVHLAILHFYLEGSKIDCKNEL